ncbi:uncharacterized protein LOC127641801 [Xyrauchen texanus]|uniref:uncharacterized protein LOC127641801 n=1 Tax=Xyrauchen texanus TaxID=154827 RepID=UPI002241C800|nr:uncharacterized protein LOC127641801 [Xyrauchen texanus]
MPVPAVVLPVVWAVFVYLRLMNQQRRHVEYRRRIRRLLCLEDLFQSDRPVTYCSLNTVVPILRLWFNVELEIKQDFRLNRQAMHALQRLMQREQDHGWGTEFEVLIYVYWLAHGLSYRVVSLSFQALEVSPTFAPQVIASCAFLHNVCIDNGDVLEPDNDVAVDILDPEPPLQEAPEAHETPGNATRDRLAALISAQAPH